MRQRLKQTRRKPRPPLLDECRGIDAADIYTALTGRIRDLPRLALELGVQPDQRMRYARLRQHLRLLEAAGWLCSLRGEDGAERWCLVAPGGRGPSPWRALPEVPAVENPHLTPLGARRAGKLLAAAVDGTDARCPEGHPLSPEEQEAGECSVCASECRDGRHAPDSTGCCTRCGEVASDG